MISEREFPCKDETYAIIGCCMEVHRVLGAGFLEAIYQEALAVELDAAKIEFDREREICVNYKGKILEKKYVPDFFCYGKVIVELKAVSTLTQEHYAQLLNYLKATGMKVGLLVNFGASSLQWKRLAF